MKWLLALSLLWSGWATAETFQDWLNRLQEGEQSWTPAHAVLGRHWQEKTTLAEMGFSQGLDIRGDNTSRSFSFGVRQDVQVEDLRLELRYVFSPALIGRISHIKVHMNEEVVGVLPIDPERAGTPVQQILSIPVDLVVDYNHVRFEMVGHYTQEFCEDPLHSSIWVEIQSDSALVMSKGQLPLASDLTSFPEPFFDARDNTRLTLPMELGPQPGLERLKTAGMLASWMGARADWRGVRFPLLQQKLPKRHAVILTTIDQLPPWLAEHIPAIDGPTVAVRSLPLPEPIVVDEDTGETLYDNPYIKLLLVLGRDERELEQAVLGLTQGEIVLSGPAIRVRETSLGAPRQPYDAPRWVRLDRPVKMGDLVQDHKQLQVQGHLPEIMRLNMRIPADLFTWGNQGVPVELKYRYTPPVAVDDSRLTVMINDEFIEAFNLREAGKGGEKTRVRVPILDENYLAGVSEFLIPAFKLGSNNQLQFAFRFGYAKQDLCKRATDDLVMAAIDPDSTIDFTDMPHYAAMPNLGFFANSGYPFTRMADLSETTLVLPDDYGPTEAQATLELLGIMGGHTGYPALRVAIQTAGQLDEQAEHDLLVIGRQAHEQLLARWSQTLPAGLGHWARHIGLPKRAVTPLYDWLGMDTRPDPAIREQVDLLGTGQLGMLLGYESPQHAGRSVVAVLGSDARRLEQVVQGLGNPGVVAGIHGSVTVFRGERSENLLVGETYMVGDLAWYLRVWYFLIRHPFVLITLTILVALVTAFLLWKVLEGLRARRLNPQD